MKYKLFFVFGALVFSSVSCFGQLEKTIHQTFETGTRTTISLDLVGTFTVIPWAGSNVMTETRIELYNGSPSILNHFVEKDQRYFIETDTSATALTLVSHDKKRDSIKTNNGGCTEVVTVKVFVPEKFVARDEKTLVLSEEKN